MWMSDSQHFVGDSCYEYIELLVYLTTCANISDLDLTFPVVKINIGNQLIIGKYNYIYLLKSNNNRVRGFCARYHSSGTIKGKLPIIEANNNTEESRKV